MSHTAHPPPKDPFDIWLELVVLILVAPLVALIVGARRLILRAVRRFANARQKRRHDASRSNHQHRYQNER